MKKLIFITAILFSTPAWANVPNATPLFNQYTCNSSTTQFPYAFQITTSSDMTVYLTDTSGNTTQLSSSVFSVDTTNLWVNYPLVGSPCTTNYVVTLRPSTPQTQTTTYGARTPFTATAVGASFDKLTLISQQLQGQINRTFLQPANVTAQVTFPSSNAGYLIGWDGSGNLANISNPSLVAQWSLSGADISYNTGNVSTTHNITASTFNGNINWPSVTSTLKSSNVNWTDINGNATINTGGINWSSINSIAKINYGGINWPSTNIFPTSATGNVGVGSSNPGQKLDVSGTVRATSFSGSGSALTSLPVLSTQNVVTGSRSYSSIYQNTSTRTMFVAVTISMATGGTIEVYTDSSATPSTEVTQGTVPSGGNGSILEYSFMVLPSNYYELTNEINTCAIQRWVEWY